MKDITLSLLTLLLLLGCEEIQEEDHPNRLTNEQSAKIDTLLQPPPQPDKL